MTVPFRQALSIQLIACLIAWLCPVGAFAEQVTVAVASNFAVAMKDVVLAYQRSHGHEVRLAPGSSAKLYAQIRNGAPFHVFLSADQSTPEKLLEQGLAVPGSRIGYAQGALVLWSKTPGLFADQAEVRKQLQSQRLALANPRLAPYGRASVQVLAALGLDIETRENRVYGENIAQTFQFAYSGNAGLGFIAVSQWLALENASLSSSWRVPQSMYEPIRQDAVLLKAGQHNGAARSLLSYLQSEQALRIMQRYGYSAVGPGSAL
ncbi:MAG: molybdate ABC transporter substrate-binding protein [Oceanococcus sp.]